MVENRNTEVLEILEKYWKNSRRENIELFTETYQKYQQISTKNV